jgi:hypothetical protein
LRRSWFVAAPASVTAPAATTPARTIDSYWRLFKDLTPRERPRSGSPGMCRTEPEQDRFFAAAPELITALKETAG